MPTIGASVHVWGHRVSFITTGVPVLPLCQLLLHRMLRRTKDKYVKDQSSNTGIVTY
jgi:hypothetical protein